MRLFVLVAGLFLLLCAGTSGARAQSCNEDLAAFGQKRNAEIAALARDAQRD